MTQAEFIAEVYGVAWSSNPDLNSSSLQEEILEELRAMKDRSMRWEIIISSFKPEPELFPIKERRQGQL
tara:strand:+ start:29 stop:235 length:207 start_codon:yes stop_codon:yes gene_type:complete